jgi:hypothetical protein
MLRDAIMSDAVRILNADGMAHFERYLNQLRGGLDQPPPPDLLSGHAYTTVADPAASLDKRVFTNRFEFGTYLADRLAPLDRRAISRNSGLWTWLALYYFDQLCPAASNGTRKVHSVQAYVLPLRYDYRIYYRHLVRTPWLVALDHGAFAKVLLIPAGASDEAPLATRGEIIEQLASRQDYLANPAIIEAAYRLYFDDQKGRPRRGAGGSSGGSPRRLATILQQLGLTFDLGACKPETIQKLLPREFERWRN